jgi:glyoxylate utilization-related uncharacterized protein
VDADLREFIEFEEGAVVRKTVFETERLWAQTVCLDRNGSYGPVSDRGADALLTILAGEAVFLIDKKRKRLKQWGAIVAPAAAELVINNASTEPLVVLMVVAPPPPPPAAGSG